MFAAQETKARTVLPTLGLSWPLIIGSLLFVLLIRQSALLNDPDVYWHITVGEWILTHRAIPNVDDLSHTMLGAPWTAHEWLSEVLFALAYRAGGWTAVVVLSCMAFATALAVLLRYLLRYLDPIYALPGVTLAFSMLAPHLLARPHTLIAPLLVLWGIGLLDAYDERRTPSYWLIPLMAIWANLHGSFVFGLALIGLFAVDAVIGGDVHQRWRTARRWAAFGMACTAAAMLTPTGPPGLGFAFAVNNMSVALSEIGEWRSPNFQQLQPLEFGVLLVAAAVLSRGLRLSWLRIVLLLGLLHLSLKHARHADLLALLGPMVLARPIAEQWPIRREATASVSAVDRYFQALAVPARGMTTVIVIAALAGAGIFAVLYERLSPPAAIAPEAAVQALKAQGIRGRGFNSYNFGGYLIFSGVSTFVDGRTDLFGDQFLAQYFHAVKGTGNLPALLDRYDIQWTLLPPSVAAVQLLDGLAGWKRLYSDAYSVLHVRVK